MYIYTPAAECAALCACVCALTRALSLSLCDIYIHTTRKRPEAAGTCGSYIHIHTASLVFSRDILLMQNSNTNNHR